MVCLSTCVNTAMTPAQSGCFEFAAAYTSKISTHRQERYVSSVINVQPFTRFVNVLCCALKSWQILALIIYLAPGGFVTPKQRLFDILSLAGKDAPRPVVAWHLSASKHSSSCKRGNQEANM